MSDVLHRFQLENLHVRGEWVSLGESWREIQKTADYPKPVKQVLGEALVAISLLADSLKFDGSLIMQIRGTLPLTMLVVQATSDGAIRGLADWQGDIPQDASFRDLFGEATGTMVISVEPNSNQGERYQSLVSLEGDSLAECFTQYFSQSEQLNTRLWMAVDDQFAAGLMLQSLPEENIQHQAEGWNRAKILADTVRNVELLELDAQELLYRLYHEEDLRLYDAKMIRFECTCSQEKIEHTIRTIGKGEADSILKERGNIEINCDFCNTKYVLDSIDVTRLFSDADVTDITGTGSVH
jgi:molecular chaperone Hsp33